MMSLTLVHSAWSPLMTSILLPQAPMAAAGKAVDFTVPEQPLAFGENLKLVRQA